MIARNRICKTLSEHFPSIIFDRVHHSRKHRFRYICWRAIDDAEISRPAAALNLNGKRRTI